MTATNSKPKRQLSYAISFGIFSGKLHGKEMRSLLSQRGYEERTDVTDADVIIAHSAGCWLIDEAANPKLVFYIGAAINNPSFHNWAMANKNNTRAFMRDRSLKGGAKILGEHIIYGTLQPKRNRDILKKSKTAVLRAYPDAQVVFIANQDDPWPNGAILEKFLDDQPWSFISLPGSHDNVWLKPETYVAIIDRYAQQLLA
jgi:hypothetical protein